MDIAFDDLISTDAANTAKAVKKFQPKIKPKPKPRPNAQPEPKPAPTPSTQSVEVPATTEELTVNDANHIIGNVLDSLQSSNEKSSRENAESVLTSDPPNDFLNESSTTVNLPPCSETPTIDGSMEESLETAPKEPELIKNIDASANLESIAEVDALTGEEQEAGNSLFWEPQPITNSGPRVSKFKPKPKAQSRKMEQISNNPDQNLGTVQHGENICSVSYQIDFMENEPVPSFTPDEILGTSSDRTTDSAPTDTISDYHVNVEPLTMDKSGRSSRRLKKPSYKALQLIDEPENQSIDDNNDSDDYVPEFESLIEEKETKSKPNSKKPLNENKKPGRKRKKDKEAEDELTEAPKKKFSHSTRRNKRQVNPELLKIPEEEFEMQMHNFPLRDLIRLREHKERLERKEASSSLGTDATDQSNGAENTTYYNYRTHMKITPRMKWTKADTEQFYQAIQQFGTDLSMIKECFHGRTREQIRSKFKKEYKQHRLRIESALSTRAKGHSQFELVIERLKQARAEDSENEDPDTLTGEEDEEVATETNEGGDVGSQKEVKDMEPDVPPADESPTKSNDFEEDDTWSHYKSDI